MKDNVLFKEDNKESIQHYCSKCGFKYESGFRYNSLIKQYIRYIRFN
ncbi:MAG: hypothetical protein ACFFDH_04375 [Promethearchaeota archaeon]